MCKVSIIMPVYNKERYIEKSINSIINQSFTEWELIIINDGSTDSTLEVCHQFTDVRVRIFSVENGGVSKARNIGLSKAYGEYITFVDGDDYLDLDYLKNLYNPQYEMSICGLTKVKASGEIIGEILPINSGEQNLDVFFKRFYKEQMNSGIYGFVAGKMIRKTLLETYKIRFNTNITLAEDYEFFLYTLLYHQFWIFLLSFSHFKILRKFFQFLVFFDSPFFEGWFLYYLSIYHY